MSRVCLSRVCLSRVGYGTKNITQTFYNKYKDNFDMLCLLEELLEIKDYLNFQFTSLSFFESCEYTT